VRGCLPLTDEVLITEPIEDSTARLAARTSAPSTGSPVLDRLLAGPGFLDAGAFPEISFRSELLVWVPDGWRAVGGLRVTRALPGGFLGDHADVGNWRCPLGLAALSVETLLLLLVVLAAWSARTRPASLAAGPRPAARHVPEYSQSR
jgi:hypothetical protein